MNEKGREDQNPWVKWYWSDWSADTGLRASSLAAKGLWIEMLAIMSKSKIRGYLLDGESKMETKTLAKIVAETESIVGNLLNELKSHGVFSEDQSGQIYNRRMAREGMLSKIRSDVGKLGGRPKKQNESKIESNLKALSASASASSLLVLISSKWNSFSEKYKLSKIDSIKKGSTRERNLILRIEQDGFDIDKVIEKIEKQPFLLGDNKQGWTVNFDFIVKASSYQKIMEEVYLKRQRGVTPEEQKKIEWEKRNKAIDELERKK